jgi:hypothetical protein
MTTTLRSTSLVDSPKEHHQPDQLEIRRYEDALVKLIQSADTPLTIALQGEWGSGKTSLMNSLRHRLSDDQGKENCFHSVWVNTWQYSLMREPQEAVVKILTSIITQIGEIHPGQEASAAKATKLLGNLGKSFRIGSELLANAVLKQLAGIDNATGYGTASADTEAKMEPNSEIQQAKMAIKSIIDECLIKSGSGKRGVLFFIDDLDRIDPPAAVQILELLKNVFDIGKCIFILAIDYDVVVKGLKPKFGEYSPATEREFRSFFDKIIQVPFSMPVANYQVDGFLLDSLISVGFLGEADASDISLAEALAFFCRSSVGTNPRSLKRLVNILSLVQLLKEHDETSDRIQKQVDFALVCLQISFPRVYGFLAIEPDFKKWDASFRKRHGLGDLSPDAKARLGHDELFDDEWEQTLYLICEENPYLHRLVFQISAILNRIASLETQGLPVAERIHASIRISSVTHVSPEMPSGQAIAFHQSSFLKDLNTKLVDKAMPLAACRGLIDFRQTLLRVQSRLGYEAMLNGKYSVSVHTLSVYPIDDRYRCQIRFSYWMLWNEKNDGDFESELRKIGRTKQQFDGIMGKLDGLGSNHPGWLKPEVDRPNEIRRGRSEGRYYFDFNVWFNYYAKSPDEFLRDDFITILSEMVLAHLLLQGETTEFLSGSQVESSVQ